MYVAKILQSPVFCPKILILESDAIQAQHCMPVCISAMKFKLYIIMALKMDTNTRLYIIMSKRMQFDIVTHK